MKDNRFRWPRLVHLLHGIPTSTEDVVAGDAIQVFSYRKNNQHFTKVDNMADGIIRAATDSAVANEAWVAKHPGPATSQAPQRVMIGATRKGNLPHFVETPERSLGMEAVKKPLPMQTGDILETHADTSRLHALTGYAPRVGVEEGIGRFVEWYREYYGKREAAAAVEQEAMG